MVRLLLVVGLAALCPPAAVAWGPSLLGVQRLEARPSAGLLSPARQAPTRSKQKLVMSSSSGGEGRLNLPNTLTLGRVAVIPLFMLSFVMRNKTAGVLIYILSCLTDLADGYLARKLKQTSSFGAFLDPVADKLMVGTALVFLVCQIPTWWFALPVALIMSREIAVSALREWMAEQGQRATVQVGSLGKIKTALQMISTAMLLEACPGAANFAIALSVGLTRPTLFSLGVALLYAATVLTLVSGFQYFSSSWPTLKKSALT